MTNLTNDQIDACTSIEQIVKLLGPDKALAACKFGAKTQVRGANDRALLKALKANPSALASLSAKK